MKTISIMTALCAMGVQALAQDYSACEKVMADENQLSAVFGCDTICLATDPLNNRAWLIDPQFLWADFASLPKQFAEAYVQSKEQIQGVTVLKLRLTRFVLSGETLVEFPSKTNPLALVAPTGYSTNNVDSASRSALWTWRQWISWGVIDANTTPTLSLDVALADVLDKPAYDAMLEAEDAACKEAEAMTSLADMLMSDSEESGGDGFLLLSQDGTPCNASKFSKLQVQGPNFFLEWFSVTNATYEIASATEMTIPTPNWISLASLYPAATGSNLTSFLDVGGATNQAKFYKVTKTGISIPLCDSNTFSGVVEIPVEIGIPTNRELAGVNFLMDGQPTMTIINPDMSSGFKPAGTWNTLYVTNGWHTLQAFASYPDAALHATGNYGSYSSQVVAVQTFNPIVFPDFPTTFGTALPITALLSSSNASWTLSILAPTNNVVRIYSGSTTTGRIDVVWDGKDSNGVSVAGDFVDIQVSTVPSGGFAPTEAGEGEDPSATVRAHKEPVGGLPPGFLLSYEEFAFHNEGNAEDGFLLMYGQVRNSVGGGPYDQIDYGAVADNSTAWTNWLGVVKDTFTGNLYHFGHGGPNGVGIEPGAHRGFTDTEIAVTLSNGFVGGIFGYFKSYVAKHPYRFVFLDGCNTGDGDLCVAFGTERKRITAAKYAQRGLPTRAFMGWWSIKQYITVGQGRQFEPDHYNFVVNFFSRWSGGMTLQNAINQSLPSGFTAPRVWGDDQLTWE
jgi:hypothetical protein